MPHQYVTTAIDYPNAAPHMGHAMEKILADVVSRWFRLRGDEVRFQIGTDEYGVKIQRTAEKEGVTPQELVDRNAVLYSDLFDRLNISYDVFVRTSDKNVHHPTVLEMWKRLEKAGWLEKKSYTGLYCVGCEEFKTKRDLVDGLCVNHKKAPEEVSEENWFFRLSEHDKYLKGLLSKSVKDGGYEIVPDFRRNEVFSFVEKGLPDVSFSRPKSTLYWGVPVPGDDDQVMYVWCDNLTNYISTLGYLTKKEDKSWWDKAEVTHVIGKDITRFHALNWPAMLNCAGVKTPSRLLVHGFITCEGSKMSKSIGNVVVPEEVIKKYGVDPLRFYLSHEVPVGRDGDFSWDRMQKLYDAKLRNDIGNLLNRVIVLLKKDDEVISVPKSPALLDDAWATYEKHMNAFELSEALMVACRLTSDCNKFIDSKKPWGLEGDKKVEALSIIAENLRHISLMLLPFIPETAQMISKQLGVPYSDQMTEKSFSIGDKKEWGNQKDWKAVGEPEILFKPLD